MKTNNLFWRFLLIAVLLHVLLAVVVQSAMGYWPDREIKIDQEPVTLTLLEAYAEEIDSPPPKGIPEARPEVSPEPVTKPVRPVTVAKSVPEPRKTPEIQPVEPVQELALDAASEENRTGEVASLSTVDPDLSGLSEPGPSDSPEGEPGSENGSSVGSEGGTGAKDVIDARPDYRSNKPPPYPLLAKRKGLEGVVILLVEIDPRGNCVNAEVLETSGYPVLDEAALKSVAGWKFYPATKNGTPVQSRVKVPIRFELKSSIG